MGTTVSESPRIPEVMVEVIVLTYNQAHLIDHALASVLDQQTRHPFHVTVHDDASDDGTREVLADWQRRHPDLITLILRGDNGLSQGINPSISAILATDSKYFAWCEGDDWWTDPLKLQKQVDFMEENPWCAISHHGVEVVVDHGGDEEYAEEIRSLVAQEWRNQRRVSGLELAGGNFILTVSAMVRRNALPERTLRAVYDINPGDWVTLALAAQAGDIGYLDDVMSAYRIHDANFWARADNELRAEGERTLWFLGTFATGPMRAAARRWAVEQWLEYSPSSPRQEVAELREALRGVQIEADALRERIHVMESTRGWRLLERFRPIRGMIWPGG